MTEVRRKVRAIILTITGGIMALLVIRFVMLLLSAPATHFLVNIIYSITDPFVTPFANAGDSFLIGTFDLPTVIAAVIIMVWGILISEIVTAFLYDDWRDILLNIVDVAFKFLEFFLIARLVLRLFSVTEAANPFVSTIYAITNWASGILPTIKVWRGELEFSVVLVLIIVLVADVTTDGLLESFLENRKKSVGVQKESAQAPKPAPAPAVAKAPDTKVFVTPAPAAPSQHITINVPMPPPQPAPNPSPVRQVINVVPSAPPPPPKLPGPVTEG